MSASTEGFQVVFATGGRPLQVGRVLGILVAYKVIYLLVVSIALCIWPESAHGPRFRSLPHAFTSDGHLTFDSHFASWDAAHYLFIASHGYKAGDALCAFYPLFPLSVRIFSTITGVSPLIAGMVLANVFSLAGWLLCFILIRRRFGESVAKSSLALLVTFPGSLFFQFIYTESLFFLLLMLLLLGLDDNRFWLTVVAAFLLPLTRAVGLFCIFPLFWYAIMNSTAKWCAKLRAQVLWRRKSSERADTTRTSQSCVSTISSGRFALQCGWLLLPPIFGWLAYLALMKRSTGNAFEGFAAQKQFGMESIGNIFNLPHFLLTFLTPSSFSEIRTSMVDRVSFVLLLYSLPIIWRLDKGWFLWAVFLGLVPAMSGMFVSYTRFASVVFPLFVAVATFLNKPGRPFQSLRFITVATFLAVQIILLWRFVNYRWAG
ncbi:MAG TPA: hypothetical protein VGO67_06880 [Verrucomicrobiae bacterium]|jgi:hypothetical protein